MSNEGREIGWLEKLGTGLKSLAGPGFGLLGLLTFAFFIIGIFYGDLLNILKETEAARGLITFLVALTTVAIAIILVIFAVASEDDQAQSFKERFSLGKEVLTALIGILGTIIGFYYGAAVTQKTAIKEPIIKVAPASISNEKPKQGETIRLTTYVSGGQAPYKYTISFTPPDKVEPIKDKESADGYIIEAIKFPETLPADTELTFKVDITDKNGEKAALIDKTKKILVKGK